VPQAPKPKRKNSWGKMLAVVALALVVVAAVFFVCLSIYNQVRQPAPVAATNTGQVVAAVGKLMLLPNETPTVAVVSDLTKLQGQKFFANAKQGDVVLMYAQAQKAILFSPTEDKIIEVAPIVNNQPQQ
jgi:hypothetical protein